MTHPSPFWWLVLGIIFNFSLATRLEVWFEETARTQPSAPSPLVILLGDSRRLLADQLYVKADIYFHRGFYPSIFDRARTASTGLNAQNAAALPEPNEAKNPSGDWIARFGRYFYPNTHIHSDRPDELSNMLPWLQASAALDPQRVETYTVAAYWLRRLGHTRQAEAFLRDGQRANPGNPEILFELGQLCRDEHHDPIRAQNLWELALHRWDQTQKTKAQPDVFLLSELLIRLAQLAEAQGQRAQAIAYLERLMPLSPNPAVIQQQITQLRQPASDRSNQPGLPADGSGVKIKAP